MIWNTALFLNAFSKKGRHDAPGFERVSLFWYHLDSKYAEEYGYLKGVAVSFGPVELAAVLMGHENFFLNLMLKPQSIHRLLEITTDSVIRWLRAHEDINGTLRRIAIADHIPGQIGLQHFLRRSPLLSKQFKA